MDVPKIGMEASGELLLGIEPEDVRRGVLGLVVWLDDAAGSEELGGGESFVVWDNTVLGTTPELPDEVSIVLLSNAKANSSSSSSFSAYLRRKKAKRIEIEELGD